MHAWQNDHREEDIRRCSRCRVGVIPLGTAGPWCASCYREVRKTRAANAKAAADRLRKKTSRRRDSK